MNSRWKKIIYVFVGLVFATGIYFTGYAVGHKNLVFGLNFKPQITNFDFGKPKDVDFSLFWSAWTKISEKYVGNIDAKKMLYGAISGMVNSLGDPYTSFLEPQETKTFSEDLSGQVSGIGAELSIKNDQLVVVAPIDDSPAQKAGIKAGDQILEIDDQSTAGLSVDEAVVKIRGRAGSQVKLLISRPEFSEPKEFLLTRAVVQIKSVKSEMKGEVAYISISQFGDDTSDLMKIAANDLIAKHPKAVILDLRGNPGGYLDSSIDVASLFMDRGVVVKEKYKDGRVEELTTTEEGRFNKTKVIVLIDEGSASASEIVAGALRDARGALIIGKKSFGKGSVQEVEYLSDGSAIKVTVAKWLTPKDKSIDKEGITPDIDVSQDEKDLTKDPQLDRALEEANK